MIKIKWANLFHIYQPPNWEEKVIKKVVKESYRPFLAIFKKQKKLKITLNINGSLTEQFVQLKLNDILADLRLLARRGQVEFTGSAKYHPILPKLPSSEIIRQIRLNTETNKKYLGKVYQPKGFFPPEMCYSNVVAKIVAKEGFRWIALDEIAYQKKLQKVDWQQGYRLKGSSLKVIFRNRLLSDLFLEKPCKEVKRDFKKFYSQKKLIVLAMDGETLGHHRPGMDKVFSELLKSDRAETVTYSEMLNEFSSFKPVSPFASSWASSEKELNRGVPYELWDYPKNPIHQLQWQLFNLIIKTILDRKSDPNFKKVRTLLDKSINSDFFWWASTHPWWSVEIIEEGTKRLIRLITSLKTIPKNKIEKALNLSVRINQLARKWQDSGKAVKERKKFLAEYEKKTYLAGKKVI